MDEELVTLYKPFAEKELAAEMEKRKSRGILALPGRLKEMEFSDDVLQKKQKQLILHFLLLAGLRAKEEIEL